MTNPQMPSMPVASDTNAPSENQGAEPVLETPVHEKPVEYVTPESDNSSVIDVPLVPKKGIEVVATSKGFFGQVRRIKGDRFTIKDFKEIGSWMKCVDPALERKRLEFYKNKKAKK